MFGRIANNRDERSLAVKLRRRRFAFFQSLLSRVERPVTILDVGGTATFWKMMGLDSMGEVFVTVLNVAHENLTQSHIRSMIGDACNIQAADKSFDVVFSNSVIEHVGNSQGQMRMATEVCRVGNRYFVQTPNKFFLLEPHFLFPFFQFLPVSIRVRLLQNFDLGWFRRTRSAAKAREIVDSIRLLDKREFASLFPRGSIYEEKVLGMTKSIVAYGGWDE